MVVRAVSAVALACICWVGASCHQSAQPPGSGAAPAAAATVRDAVVTGTVADSLNNRPVPGVMVIVTHIGQRPGEGHVATANTNETGQYALRVPFGRYDLYYMRIGFSVERRLGVLLSGTKPDSIVIILRENHQYLDRMVVNTTPR